MEVETEEGLLVLSQSCMKMTKIEGVCPGASCLMTLTAMWLDFRSLVFCKTDMLAWDYFSSVAAMVF